MIRRHREISKRNDDLYRRDLSITGKALPKNTVLVELKVKVAGMKGHREKGLNRLGQVRCKPVWVPGRPAQEFIHRDATDRESALPAYGLRLSV